MSPENRKKKTLLMKAVKRLDEMTIPKGKARVVGQIANDFEEAALCFMDDDGDGAMEALHHAAGLQKTLGIDLLGDLVVSKRLTVAVPEVVAEVPALAMPVTALAVVS